MTILGGNCATDKQKTDHPMVVGLNIGHLSLIYKLSHWLANDNELSQTQTTLPSLYGGETDEQTDERTDKTTRQKPIKCISFQNGNQRIQRSQIYVRI